MRRQRKKRSIFIGLVLNSLGAVFAIIGLMFLFARSFGELAIPAIHMMAVMMYIPIVTFIIGIVGWFWAERAEW